MSFLKCTVQGKAPAELCTVGTHAGPDAARQEQRTSMVDGRLSRFRYWYFLIVRPILRFEI